MKHMQTELLKISEELVKASEVSPDNTHIKNAMTILFGIRCTCNSKKAGESWAPMFSCPWHGV